MEPDRDNYEFQGTDIFTHPGGITACSRWSSEATPPDRCRVMNRTPAGVPAGHGAYWRPELAGTPSGVRNVFHRAPVVSLVPRSPTGYRLISLRLGESQTWMQWAGHHGLTGTNGCRNPPSPASWTRSLIRTCGWPLLSGGGGFLQADRRAVAPDAQRLAARGLA